MAKPYRILDHTADIRIVVESATLEELFANAGAAIFDISSRRQFTKSKTRTNIRINLKALALEELFINWLNELLSLSAVKRVIFYDFNVAKIKDNCLQAVATGSGVENFQLKTEVKAATYHGLSIRQVGNGWQAEVILDV